MFGVDTTELLIIAVAALIFIVINFLLTWAATRLSRRLSSRTAGDAGAPTTPVVGAPTDKPA